MLAPIGQNVKLHTMSFAKMTSHSSRCPDAHQRGVRGKLGNCLQGFLIKNILENLRFDFLFISNCIFRSSNNQNVLRGLKIQKNSFVYIQSIEIRTSLSALYLTCPDIFPWIAVEEISVRKHRKTWPAHKHLSLASWPSCRLSL